VLLRKDCDCKEFLVNSIRNPFRRWPWFRVGATLRAKMKWDETVASRCRYSEEAETIWGTWEILWEESTADYQGEARFWAHDPVTKKYCYVEWSYGSCSGCDSWEAAGYPDEKIREIMRTTEVSVWFDDLEHVHNWMEMIESTVTWGINELFGLTWHDAGSRLEGLHKALGLPEFDWSKWRKRRPGS
jgi:hypothetical protein